MHARSAIVLSSLLVVPLLACDGGGDDDSTAKPGPDIELFEASPPTVKKNENTTLRYRVKDAATVRIDTMDGASVLSPTPTTDGSVETPNLEDTTTFVLTAMSANGKSATASLTVLVEKDEVPPQIVNFSADPTTIEVGSSTTLSWQIEGATAARIETGGTAIFNVPNDQIANGTFQHSPAQTTTYTLVALNGSLESRMDVMVTVNGAQPVIRSFRANPPTINPGMSADLLWEVTNATMVTITDDANTTIYSGGDLTGSRTVSPATTTRYTLTASDGTNNVTQTVTVSVQPGAGASIVRFEANPAMIYAGQSTNLEWEVQDAPDGVEIRINGALLSSSQQTTGSMVVMPNQTTTYELRALNPAGNASRMVTVQVTVPNAPVILAFMATPNPVGAGAMTTLSWQTLASTTVRVLQGATELLNTTTMVAQGTLQVSPTADTTYTLEASDGTNTATMDVTVYAHPAPTINTFTVDPLVLNGPTNLTITWNVSDYARLTLTQNGAPTPGFNPPSSTTSAIDHQGTLTVTVSQPTLFVLTASSAGGLRTAQVQVGMPMVGTETEPNDDFPMANPFPQGGQITATLTAGDVDVFEIIVPEDGSVRVQTSDGMGGCSTDTLIGLFDGAFNLVTFDDDSGTAPCSLIDPTVDGAANNLPAGTYYVVVEHWDPAGTGSYVVDIQIEGPACGNGDVEGNEQCDFGDLNDNDGCSSTCQLEINPTVISGTGGNVIVTFNGPNDIAIIRVDVQAGQAVTATAADVGGTTCNTIDTAMNFGDSNFLLLGGTAGGGPTGTAGTCAAIHYPADAYAADLAAGSYYLVVFNQGQGTGQVQVSVGIRNSVCGNGLFETRTEQCDDGNRVSGDLCDASCNLELDATVSLPSPTPVTVQGAITAPTYTNLIRVDVSTELYLRVATFAPNQAQGCAQGVDTVAALTDQQLNFLGGIDDLSQTNYCAAFDERWAFTRLTPGTYYLLVYDSAFDGDDEIPAYEVVISGLPVPANAPALEVEPNDTQATATPTGLVGAGSVSMHGDLVPTVQNDGDDDVYSFVIPAGQTRMVSVQTYDMLGMPMSCNPGDFFNDTRVFVERAGVEAVDPNTGELASNDDRDPAANLWCSRTQPVAVTAGAQDTTFYVRVQGYNDEAVFGRRYFLDITVQ